MPCLWINNASPPAAITDVLLFPIVRMTIFYQLYAFTALTSVDYFSFIMMEIIGYHYRFSHYP